jgi:hypothetical protein
MTRILLSAAIAVSFLAAQEPAPRLFVSGMVITTGGEPIRKARVILRAKEETAFSYTADSDANGRFKIQDVVPGQYSVFAQREGYMPEDGGAFGAPPPSLKIEAGQSVTDLKVKLIPPAIVTGRVLDDDGDPIRGARVEAMTYNYMTGKKQLNTVNQASANDKGEYRLFGLQPGPLYIRASGNNRNRFTGASLAIGSFTPTYFPSTTNAALASPIDLAAGAQVAGIDIRLKREKHYSVRGKLPEVMKHDVTHRVLQILPRDGFPRGSSLRQDEETFEFVDVLPGSYVITGDVVSAGKRSVVRQAVDVTNADVDGVILNFVAPVSVSGSVRVEGVLPRPLEKMQVTLYNDVIAHSSVEVKPDGTFAIPEMMPDVYQITSSNHPGTYVKSIRFGDEEASESRVDLTKGVGPLTLVLATDVGDVKGSVKKTNGDPAVRVRVTLIASGNHSRRADLSGYGFTDEEGKFLLHNIAPGEYKAYAWLDAPFLAPQDPDFRKPFEKQAMAVKLDPNGHATVDLTVISVKAGVTEPRP